MIFALIPGHLLALTLMLVGINSTRGGIAWVGIGLDICVGLLAVRLWQQESRS